MSEGEIVDMDGIQQVIIGYLLLNSLKFKDLFIDFKRIPTFCS